MKKVVLTQHKEKVCRVCDKKLEKGDVVWSTESGYRRYECEECHERFEENGVLIYQPAKFGQKREKNIEC